MEFSPLISVLIPTINRDTLCKEAIDSVGNRSDVEIVVVDNGSDKEIFYYLEELTIDRPNMRLYRNENNIGMVKNFNKAFSLATGQWFAILCSDDYFKPGAIGRMVDFLGKVAEPCLIVYSRSTSMAYSPPGPDNARNLRLPAFSGTIFHREIYDKLGGFDERLTFLPDTEYWYRIAAHYPVVGVPERYARYREHENNFMWDTWRQADKFLDQIRMMTKLNMVHRGESTDDLDVVCQNQSDKVWETIVYILRTTARKKGKQDIFDMYYQRAVPRAYNFERKNILQQLKKARDNA